MALIACHECGTHISDDARVCPSCGTRTARYVYMQQLAITMVVIFVLVVFFSALILG
jgi:RNA polymerase subunit RPABC4/transcription elongation factor Spt4